MAPTPHPCAPGVLPFSTPGRPRTDFYRFLAVPRAIKKTWIFRLGPKSTQGGVTIDPCALHARFWVDFDNFWVPFSLHFSINLFVKVANHVWRRQLHTLRGFRPSKTSHFRQIFHQFSCFFQNPSRTAFFEAQSAGLSSKVRFWSHFRFSRVLKIDHWASISAKKCIQKL